MRGGFSISRGRARRGPLVYSKKKESNLNENFEEGGIDKVGLVNGGKVQDRVSRIFFVKSTHHEGDLAIY